MVVVTLYSTPLVLKDSIVSLMCCDEKCMWNWMGEDSINLIFLSARGRPTYQTDWLDFPTILSPLVRLHMYINFNAK